MNEPMLFNEMTGAANIENVLKIHLNSRMGKTGEQNAKHHNYPKRKPYETSRKGIGGRKRKFEEKPTGSLTYFDKLKLQQPQKSVGQYTYENYL